MALGSLIVVNVIGVLYKTIGISRTSTIMVIKIEIKNIMSHLLDKRLSELKSWINELFEQLK